MKKVLAAVAVAAFAAATAGTALGDPNNGQTVPLNAWCTGLGNVTLYQQGPAHTDAFLVGGSTAVVLAAFNGAPGLYQQAVAAGTICSIAGFGTGPVLITP